MIPMILHPQQPIVDFELLGGGKAKNLARLSQLGMPVPEWICLSTEWFEEYLKRHQLQDQLVPSGTLAEFQTRVENIFLNHPIPESLMKPIEEALNTSGLLNTWVAIRSSGLDEDSEDHSFAGLFSSFLFQKGSDAISVSIRKCWASAYSERALSYRLERGISTSHPRMGVIIQKMVNADVSGVLFTRDPIHPLNRDHLIIDSVWGLGEGLVSGELDADHYVMNRQTGEVVKKNLSIKEKGFFLKPEGGIQSLPIEESRQRSESLTDSQRTDLVQASLTLEQGQTGKPLDLEWAFEKGKLYILQMRPVTSLPDEAFFSASINGRSANLWDNSNIVESFSGVTSPFTFSFASYAYREVYRQFAEMMFVPEAVILENEHRFRNMLGLIRGRIYYNLINWYRLLMILPGAGSNAAFMETMMGVKKKLSSEHQKIFDFVRDIPNYGIRVTVRLAAASLYRYLKSDQIIQDFKDHFNSIYQVARKKDFRSLSLQDQLDDYLFLQDKILRKWQAPIVNDFLCMIFFGTLKKLTEKWVETGDAGASLQNDLLCGQGDLESTEPTKMLMRIAKKIDLEQPGMKSLFLNSTSEEIWNHPLIPPLFAEFLDRYGFRCINELKLEEKDLHDDPHFVVNIVSSYIRMKSYSIEAMEEREKTIRVSAENQVKQRISGIKRSVYFWVLHRARKAVRVREDLRFDRTKIYGVVRKLIRAMGSNLEKLGILDQEQDVFYLTIDEITSFIEGRSSTHDFKPIVQSRKRIFDEYRNGPSLPDRFVTYGTVGASLRYTNILLDGDLLRDSLPQSTDPNVLHGTPCCPGVVEGIVRVAHHPKDAEGLAGEILVTSRTDPGWVPLYPSCSGLLIERGSLLSHSAVVARELGLPTIVGVSGGLMQKLKSGQKIRMDAGKGEIRIL